MRNLFSTIAVLGTALVGLQACADQPTAPGMVVAGESAAMAKGGRRPKVQVSQAIDTPMLTAAGEVGGTLQAVVYLTRIDLVEGQLVGTVRVIGTATTAVGAQAVDVTTTAPLSINGQTGTAQLATASGAEENITPQALGTCDILNLDLGPLHLDLLGLVVDLNQVNLDIVAQTGAGNLLGNLLCAVVSLLDGVAILPLLTQLLEQINALLTIIF
jgi:hypothetical protein